MALFCIFCWWHQKIGHNLDTQFKCTSKIFLSKHDLDKWPHFFIYYLNSIQGLFYKVRACMWLFRKRRKMLKGGIYLEIWAKISKIWKYFEKGKVTACNYCMQETDRIDPVICWHFSFLHCKTWHQIYVTSINKKFMSHL